MAKQPPTLKEQLEALWDDTVVRSACGPTRWTKPTPYFAPKRRTVTPQLAHLATVKAYPKPKKRKPKS